MKFTLPTALLLATLTAVLAQDSSSSASSSTMTSSASDSSSSSSSSGGSGGGNTEGIATATCTLLSGDPTAQAFGCPRGATTVTVVPDYNSASVQSYLLAQYSADGGNYIKGAAVSEVASQLANSVTKLYPTLTVSYASIVEQYHSAIEKEINPSGNGAAYNKISAVAAVAVAVVAGGAFVL